MSRIVIENTNVDTAKNIAYTEYQENTYGDSMSYGYLSRYQAVPTIYNSDRSQYTHSNLQQFYIQQSTDDTILFAKDNERLDILAEKYYGNATYWWMIAVSSNITDPFNILQGTLIRIPPLSSLQSSVSMLKRT